MIKQFKAVIIIILTLFVSMSAAHAEMVTTSWGGNAEMVYDTGWKKVGDRWTWLLQSGRNTLRVRAANKLGAKGKLSSFVINHADRPFAE